MINLKEKMHDIQDYFSPKVIGEVNDVYVKLAKIKGEDVPWHNHKDEDELFYIVQGELLFEVEDKPSFVMKEGDLFIVPKGVNHRVSSTAECMIMLIENKSTKHTGDVRSPVTKSIEEQL
jgi:quercetin dioxygenase-like cupin family protein